MEGEMSLESGLLHKQSSLNIRALDKLSVMLKQDERFLSNSPQGLLIFEHVFRSDAPASLCIKACEVLCFCISIFIPITLRLNRSYAN